MISRMMKKEKYKNKSTITMIARVNKELREILK